MRKVEAAVQNILVGRTELRLALVNRTRQNHGLEHGTVAVLIERGVRPPLAGYATPGGFFIFSRESDHEVVSAASEALRRLQAGNREIAVSPYCGTNMAVGALMAGLAWHFIMRRSSNRVRRVPLLVAAIVGTSRLKEPIGKLVQRHITTKADVDDIEIVGVKRLQIGPFSVCRVTTARIGPEFVDPLPRR